MGSLTYKCIRFVPTGRQLSAMVLPERRLVQVDAKKVYSEPKGKD
jgi:hypothetical protein